VTGYDAIVVGGGVVGCAAARELAPDHDVLLVEKDTVASGATGKASGLVSPVYDHQANMPAARHATDFFEDFDGTGHVSVAWPGGVFLYGDDERDHAGEATGRAQEAGFAAENLDPAGLGDRYPGMFDTDAWAGAVVFDEVGWVDSHTVATTLQAQAADRGAEFRTGLRVKRVLADERVTGVRTDHGDFDAPTVVVAAGWRTRQVIEEHVPVPTRPFRYQTAELEVEQTLGDGFPVAWEHETLLYWRATREGSLHVGGRPYFVGSPGTTAHGATAEFKHTLARQIPSYLPSVGDPRLRSDDTCLTGDAATPDGVPIIDAPAEAPDGLVVATGMHGFGIMLAPVAGATIRALVTGKRPPFPIEPYAVSRFDDRGTDFGSPYIAPPR